MIGTMARLLRAGVAGGLLLALAACGGVKSTSSFSAEPARATLDVHRSTKAIAEANAKRAQGVRVWCVPFARTLSGIEIRGNAETWFAAAAGVYNRGHDPKVGAVMVFSDNRKLTAGHVAVVSEIVSDREIRVDHANWKRNQVTLKMSVIDVSDRGDWSAVKVESNPGVYGSVYPISGFVYPEPIGPVVVSTSGAY